jgi:exopolyphosphatase/pppGpp-phosphohydrolase
VVCDCGGGSTELVHLHPQVLCRDSLPLGAVRLFQSCRVNGGWSAEAALRTIEEVLADSVLTRCRELIATGGTAKALAWSLCASSFDAAEVARFTAEVISRGPPPGLSPERARVLAPGLLLLSTLIKHLGVQTLRYQDLSIGRAYLRALRAQEAEAAKQGGARALTPALARDLRLTRIWKAARSKAPA